MREMPAKARGLYRARYRIPGALAERVAGKRFAIVDDVMSAGSALRGTYADLRAHGATCVVAGRWRTWWLQRRRRNAMESGPFILAVLEAART